MEILIYVVMMSTKNIIFIHIIIELKWRKAQQKNRMCYIKYAFVSAFKYL